MLQVSIRKLSSTIIIFSLGIITAVAAMRFLGDGIKSQDISNNQKNSSIQSVVEEESVTINVVEKVSPSVVSIAVENRALFDPIFGFGRQNDQKQSGIGTGFVVGADGLILTNNHVVSDNNEKYIAIIKDKDGVEKKYPVKEVHKDPTNDLALVRIEARDLKPVEMGDSNALKVGQKVIAIGNALGEFQNTVTTGVVSALGRAINPVDPLTGVAETLDDLIQTDAAINPGNSGGPLVNSAGQVIGVNSAVASAQNIGFAIKINVAKQLIDDFNKAGGKISRPLLGIRYTYISKDLALLNEVVEGAYVREVVANSGADIANIKVGDIITTIDSQKLSDENSVGKIIRGKKVGDNVKVRVFRDGQTLDLNVILGESSDQ